MLALVEFVGGVCELAGALLMANALLGIVPGWDVPKYLGSALVNGKLATGLQRAGGLTPEDRRQSLRGLAFIALGFVLKVAVIGWRLIFTTPATSAG